MNTADGTAKTPLYDPADPAQRQALELLGRCINCGLVLCSEDRAYTTAYVNDLFPQFLGYSSAAFIRKYRHYADCIHPEDKEYVQSAIAAALEKSDCYDLIYRVLRKDDNVVWIRENGKRVVTPTGERLLICLLVDISADMATRQEIERQSTTDALTGIMNRVAFVDQIKQLFSETPRGGRRHALIMLDLDHFKEINDSLGHAYGDKTLADVSQSLKTLIRAGDMLGRLGGDEFVLCLKDVPPGDIIQGRISQVCARMHRRLRDGLTLSCSLGVAYYPDNGLTFEKLYRCADIALYEAKKTGRDRFMFYRPDMNAHEFIPHNTPIDEAADRG